LVENRADINKIVNNKFSALTLICKFYKYWKSDCRPIIKYLVEKGADVNLPVNNNKTLYIIYLNVTKMNP